MIREREERRLKIRDTKLKGNGDEDRKPDEKIHF